MKSKKLILCLVVLISVLIAVAGAVTPVYCQGNPECSDINCTSQSCIGDGCPGESFKLENVSWGGNHVIPGTTCYIRIDMFNKTHFTFISNAAINAVIVKGGPGSNVYFYNPPVYSDSELLSTPLNPTNGVYYDISHIEFCYERCNIPVPEFPLSILGLALIGSIFGTFLFIKRRSRN